MTGALDTTWTNVATVWAEISPVSAKEFIAAQVEDSKVTTRILIRYRSDFDHSCRIYHAAKNQYYNIEGKLSDKDSGLEYLTLPCSEGLRYYESAETQIVTYLGENITYLGEQVTYTA